MTAESALIVPVPEAEQAVGDIRGRFDPAATAGVPAHITVLYPFIEPGRFDVSIRGELGSILGGVAPFRFELVEIRRFPDVLYLAPRPTAMFLRLTAAIVTRWPGYPPYGGEYQEVIPHLTLAHDVDEATEAEVAGTVEPLLPIACTATEVHLLFGGTGTWTVHQRFPFDGRPL